MFKLILYSDWHIGATKDKTIQRVFKEMAEHKPHLVVNAGDNNGGWYGSKATRTILMRQREAMPDVPSCQVLGNHDLWARGRKAPFTGDHLSKSFRRPSPETWDLNYSEIVKHMKTFNMHFLDEDGIYRDPKWPGLAVVGHTMWYEHSCPPSNDGLYMPYGYNGDTFKFLKRRGYDSALTNLELLEPKDTTRIFVSHFPVIDTGNDSEFSIWSGSAAFGESLHDVWGVKYFLNGHAHQRHEGGSRRWEAGSDYGRPKFIVIEIPELNEVKS